MIYYPLNHPIFKQWPFMDTTANPPRLRIRRIWESPGGQSQYNPFRDFVSSATAVEIRRREEIRRQAEEALLRTADSIHIPLVPNITVSDVSSTGDITTTNEFDSWTISARWDEHDENRSDI